MFLRIIQENVNCALKLLAIPKWNSIGNLARLSVLNAQKISCHKEILMTIWRNYMVLMVSILSRIKADHLWLKTVNVKKKKNLTTVLRRTNAPLVMFALKSVKPKLLWHAILKRQYDFLCPIKMSLPVAILKNRLLDFKAASSCLSQLQMKIHLILLK